MERMPQQCLRWLIAALLAVALAGCNVELYSELNEEEANEMVALLLANGIDASKGTPKKGLVALKVQEADLSAAVEILRQNGYPKKEFHDLGAIFQQQGLISSPLEEQVRYVYGLSQTVSETLTQIDGVITARVHVVVPETNAIGDTKGEATASVFLKTRPGAQIEDRIQQIKVLVQNSVSGLAYENVSVAIFEAEAPANPRASGPPMQEFLGMRYTADSLDAMLVFAGAIGALLLVAVGGNVYLLTRADHRSLPALPTKKDA